MRGPVVAYTSLRFIASQSDSRVLSVAHTPAKPEEACSQAMSFRPPNSMTTSFTRSGFGSTPECFPKKFSSSTAAREVWASVEPIIPNLKGLTPSCCSIFSPFFKACLEYSYWIISGFFGVRVRLPLSQVSIARHLVVRRQRRVRFAVSLDLRRLVDRLPSGARGRPVARQRFTLVGLDPEHQAVADVAVVRDGEERSARLVLPGLHPFPQILGVLAVLGRERQHLVGLGLAVAVDHVPVQVVAASCCSSTRSR